MSEKKRREGNHLATDSGQNSILTNGIQRKNKKSSNASVSSVAPGEMTEAFPPRYVGRASGFSEVALNFLGLTASAMAEQISGVASAKVTICTSFDAVSIKIELWIKSASFIQHAEAGLEKNLIPALEKALEKKLLEKTILYHF